jgi:hypothetical protein
VGKIQTETERGERDSTTEIFESQLASNTNRNKDCIVQQLKWCIVKEIEKGGESRHEG